MGSVAEASLKLNGVFEAAQAAQDAVIDRVTPTDVQQLLDEPFDLALLTQQRNGNTWIAVYCDLK